MFYVQVSMNDDAVEDEGEVKLSFLWVIFSITKEHTCCTKLPKNVDNS